MVNRGTHYVEAICTYKDIGKHDQAIALQSFPSGHCASAFAGFTFLSLWLRARMYSRKIVHRNRETAGSNTQADGSPGAEDDGEYQRHTHFLLSVLVVLPLWAASVIAILVVRDHIHHWWDSVGGAIIGILCAFNSWNNFYRGKSGIPVLPKGWAQRVKKMEEAKEKEGEEDKARDVEQADETREAEKVGRLEEV
jgi:membrane-associated phospholipid phosphatase